MAVGGYSTLVKQWQLQASISVYQFAYYHTGSVLFKFQKPTNAHDILNCYAMNITLKLSTWLGTLALMFLTTRLY